MLEEVFLTVIIPRMLQAHYDLAISVALWWLDREEGRDAFDGDIM